MERRVVGVAAAAAVVVDFGIGENGTEGLLVVVLLKRSRGSMGGRAGRALEKRDLPVLGVWRDDEDCCCSMVGQTEKRITQELFRFLVP